MALNDLAKYHNEWVRMVVSMGGDSFSEDIVQEMYIKIYEKQYNVYNDKGEINKMYVYLTLRSIFANYMNKKNKIQKINIDFFKEDILDKQFDLFLEDSNEIEWNIAAHSFSKELDKEVLKWNWYDRKMFEIYRHSGMSIRKMADEIGISWVSIFHTLKKCKQSVKDNLENEYNQYLKNE